MSVLQDAALSVVLGGKPQVLAQATGPNELVLIGTRTHLALRRDGDWRAFGWHEVERGSWKGATNTFRWTTMDAEKFEVQLDNPGRMPELFKERVDASTLMTFQYELEVGDVRIVARRALDDEGAIDMYAVASRGASLNDPETRAFVIEESDRLREEYGSNW